MFSLATHPVMTDPHVAILSTEVVSVNSDVFVACQVRWCGTGSTNET